MVSVLNFKPYENGHIRGFFDLRYHGLTIKSCRLMAGTKGLWFSFPQVKVLEEDGEVTYYDQMFVSSLEREHIRKLVILDLEAQGYLDREPPAQHRTPDGEDLSEHYTGTGQGEDISF